LEAVNTELPQLLTAVILGTEGIALGVAIPAPGVLEQPLGKVRVTE
jgi:hypothetical protein